MSVARPARNLLGRCIASSRTASVTVPLVPCSQFHSTPPRSKRKSRFRNVTAQELGLIKESGEFTAGMDKYKQDKFADMSKQDLESLKASYTPEQLEAIELGEKAINPEDMIIQGRLRDDPYKPTYIEDYAVLDPRYDIKPEIEGTPREVQWPDKSEWIDNYGQKMMKITDKKTSDQLTRAMIVGFGSQGEVEPSNLELIQDGPAGVDRAYTAEAPDLGKVPGVKGLYKHAVDPEDQGQDDSGKYQEIKRLTGMSLKDIRSLLTKGLVTRWVSNQTRLGKVRSTSVVAIAGNGNGRLGLGMAKSTEAGVAEETAQMLAIRNMKPVRRYENRTIYGNVSAKISGTVVELMARPPGFGLRCPHRIFEMCRAAGIHDIAARMPRSKNPMNSVKAAYQALTNQPDPEQIAIGRGKKLVDVRKVYYGGAVY
ncbi:hypothetical protein ACJA88_004194 [Fusarium oxysporum]